MSGKRPKISFFHWFVQNGNEAFTTEPASTDFLVTPASQASIDVPSWSQATTTSYALEPLPYATALDTSASTLETHLPPNRHVKHSKANGRVVSELDPKVQDVCEKNPILLTQGCMLPHDLKDGTQTQLYSIVQTPEVPIPE